MTTPNNDQIVALATMNAALQLALVHLSRVVAASSGISVESLARSFERTADEMPEGDGLHPAFHLVFHQIADLMRKSEANSEVSDLMARLRQTGPGPDQK